MSLDVSQSRARHVPVMLPEVLAALCPAAGETYVDATFGAGGYTRAILDAADCKVIAIDRDPQAIAGGQDLVRQSNGRLQLIHGEFSSLRDVIAGLGIDTVQGVVMDIGVSSMQLDQAERGFSFMREGPLDMRMSLDGTSAADYVNSMEQDDLSRVIFLLGEEPRARAIARAIVAAREVAPLVTTLDLVRAVERATGPQRAKDRTHPATRTFQALRIFVNAELDELVEALSAAEDILSVGGRLVVVSFHSLEDRIVKRFLSERSATSKGVSRYMPGEVALPPPSFSLMARGHAEASDEETALNARSRSAKLRWGVRTAAGSFKVNAETLGVPGARSKRA
jgi:16S rRNA (cytosine1402-N4)-methyltransferase